MTLWEIAMKNRIFEDKTEFSGIKSLFICDEFQPGAPYWNIISPFAYDIKPSYILGTLGKLFDNSYSILELSDDPDCLIFGYTMTITEPLTIQLLDKLKCFQGFNALSFHYKMVVKTYTENSKKSKKAFCYILSPDCLDSFESIKSIERGIWRTDDKVLTDFANKVVG